MTNEPKMSIAIAITDQPRPKWIRRGRCYARVDLRCRTACTNSTATMKNEPTRTKGPRASYNITDSALLNQLIRDLDAGTDFSRRFDFREAAHRRIWLKLLEANEALDSRTISALLSVIPLEYRAVREVGDLLPIDEVQEKAENEAHGWIFFEYDPAARWSWSEIRHLDEIDEARNWKIWGRCN